MRIAGIYTPPVSEAQLGPGERPIGPYERKPVSVAPWDPGVVVVAERVIAIVEARRPELHLEHIGSTGRSGPARQGHRRPRDRDRSPPRSPT
jgi:hypothetical protein